MLILKYFIAKQVGEKTGVFYTNIYEKMIVTLMLKKNAII
jgi:hypothetical protein